MRLVGWIGGWRGREQAHLLDVGVRIEIELPANVEANSLRVLARVLGLQLDH